MLYILIPVVLVVVWWGSVKPLLASQAFVRNKVGVALSKNTFVNHEARKVLAQQGLKDEDPDFVRYAISVMEDNVRERPKDAKSWILLSYLYNRVEGWGAKRDVAADRALELAPNRQSVQKLQELR